MEFVYKTSGTCSQQINFNIDGNVITGIRFLGGCNGNLKAVAKLVDGMTVDEIESKLKGISCGGRPTSCADQLARAVREAQRRQSGNGGDGGSAGADHGDDGSYQWNIQL